MPVQPPGRVNAGGIGVGAEPGGEVAQDGPARLGRVGDKPVKVLATYLVEKGKPLATPAP